MTLRVLYLAPPGRIPGQLSRYSFLDEEIRALADAGVEIYVLSSADPVDRDDGPVHIRAVPRESLLERARTVAFALRHIRRVPLANLFNARWCYLALREERLAAELVQREHISLIHSFFARPLGFGGAIAKAATGVPLVAGLRGVDVNAMPQLGYGAVLRPFFRRATGRLMRTADQLVCVSDFVRRDAMAIGAPANRTRVVFKGVRLDLFRPDADRQKARATLGVACGPVVLAVAGLIPIKGLDGVLEALALVRDDDVAFTFLICGEGPERPRLESLATRLGLMDRVRFAGRIGRREIATYFGAADLFVHGALIEASGNVLLEAMASGLPVVCTDAGGPAEYVRDGVAGFVVPVGDTRAMASRITHLLANPKVRQEMSTRARCHVEAHFGYERMIRDTLDVYRSVVR